MRVAVVLLMLLVTAPSAAAQVPAALGPDGRVFTLTGNGIDRPREGLPAYRARGLFASAAPLPGGDVALLLRPGGRPWLAGLDGRLHALPKVRNTGLIASSSDGALLVVDHLMVRGLRPDRSGWDVVLDIRKALPGSDPGELSALAVFPGGGIAFSLDQTEIWRAAPGGPPRRVDLPEQTEATALAALPGGELVVGVEDSGGESRLMIVPDGGSARRLTSSEEIFYGGIAALPGGGLVAAAGTLDALDPAGRRIARIGRDRELGTGDGGPSADASLVSLSVTAADDGTVLASDFPSARFEHLETGSAIDDAFVRLLAGSFRLPIRALVPPGTARPFAAVAPETFRSLADGSVAVESTFAGRATVVVTRRGREVARAAEDIPAGRSTVALPRSAPRGDLTVDVEVLAAGGRVAGGRLEVSTFSRLSLRMARRTIRRADALVSFMSEDREHTSGCRRTSARRFACRVRRGGGRCVGGVFVTQRPDGRHIRIVGRQRGC